MTSLSLSTSLTSAKKALRRSSSFASAMAPDSFFSKPIRVRDLLSLPFLSGWFDGAPRAVTERLFRRCPHGLLGPSPSVKFVILFGVDRMLFKKHYLLFYYHPGGILLRPAQYMGHLGQIF